IIFLANDLEKMRITTDGYVGIGTTSPNSKLAVKGGIAIGTSSGYYSATVVDGAIFEGKVGIGTTSPSQTLHVAGTAGITTSVAVTDDRTLCTIAASGEIELKDGACGTSALRYKENIEKLGYGLNEINLLKPIFFNYKNFDENYTMRTKRRIGFIAEEVLPIVPEVVIMTEDGQADSIDYAYLVSLLTRGVQELDQKIESVNSQFIEKMKQYLESVGLWVENGIAKVKELIADKIITKQICLTGDDGETVCVNKDQLKQLMGQDSAVISPPTPTPTPTPTPIPTEPPPPIESPTSTPILQ
ncbi:MAG: tail fiber domain-containing protein, partial [Patescibacteria group bacterium]